MMALYLPVVEIDTFYLCSVDGVAHDLLEEVFGSV